MRSSRSWGVPPHWKDKHFFRYLLKTASFAASKGGRFFVAVLPGQKKTLTTFNAVRVDNYEKTTRCEFKRNYALRLTLLRDGGLRAWVGLFGQGYGRADTPRVRCLEGVGPGLAVDFGKTAPVHRPKGRADLRAWKGPTPTR